MHEVALFQVHAIVRKAVIEAAGRASLGFDVLLFVIVDILVTIVSLVRGLDQS